MDLLTFGRSKNVQVNLTIQAYSQLVANYGQHGATTIIDNIDFLTLMRANSVESANWQSFVCGDKTGLTGSYSYGASGASVNRQVTQKPRFHPDFFRRLKKASPESGIEYVFMSPYCYPTHTHLETTVVRELQPASSKIAARIEKRPSELYFNFWDPNKSLSGSGKKGITPISEEEFVS